MKVSGTQGCAVKVRFCQPPEPLRRYFTTFYLVETDVPGDAKVTDLLLPEWGNLRFLKGSLPVAQTLDGRTMPPTAFAATGPSSETVRFTIGTARQWGIGLLPLGWAKFVGTPAETLANAVVCGNTHSAFESFRALGETLHGDAPDTEAELERIADHFMQRIDEPVPDEERIVAIHAALVDPETASVAALGERAGASSRTVERVCRRHFGFPPKLLLRRQRFMRSLSQFMLDPSLRWIGAMDGHYHDQAQFVRDFRQFTGMTPSAYAAMPKPILAAVIHERARYAGSAVQALDRPTGQDVRG